MAGCTPSGPATRRRRALEEESEDEAAAAAAPAPKALEGVADESSATPFFKPDESEREGDDEDDDEDADEDDDHIRVHKEASHRMLDQGVVADRAAAPERFGHRNTLIG